MVKITAQRVKALRVRTAAGVMDCKRALVKTGDDLDRAAEFLEERRLTPRRIESRPTPEGLVAYHVQGRRAVGRRTPRRDGLRRPQF